MTDDSKPLEDRLTIVVDGQLVPILRFEPYGYSPKYLAYTKDAVYIQRHDTRGYKLLTKLKEEDK